MKNRELTHSMFCFIALLVFSILAAFSATHRPLAKEALDCVFHRVTFRPCQTGFREKVKTKILVKLMSRWSFGAKMFNRHFELMSWIFFFLMIWSTYAVIIGGYNFYQYGSCNGLNADGFCVFDPKGENNETSIANTQCYAENPTPELLSLNGFLKDQFPVLNKGAQNEFIFMGCYACDYTRKAYPNIQKLLKEQGDEIEYTFVHFPVKGNTKILSNYAYCSYKQKPENFWSFNNSLFETKKDQLENLNYINDLAKNAGYDLENLLACVNSEETKKIIENQIKHITYTNIYGTPTVFINKQPLVGPKPYRVYKNLLNK